MALEGVVEYVDILRYEGDIALGYATCRIVHPDDSADWIEVKGPVAMFPNGEIYEYMLQGADRDYGAIMPRENDNADNP